MGLLSWRTAAPSDVTDGTKAQSWAQTLAACLVRQSISCSSRGILPMLINASAPLNLHEHVFKL